MYEHLSGAAPAVPARGGGNRRSDPLDLDQAALDAVTDAVFALDAAMRVTSWNAAAERLYGVAAADAVGRPFSDHVSCHPSPAEHPGNGRSPAPDGLANGPATHVVRSGLIIPVRVSLIAFRGTRRGRRYVALVQDDTEHLRLTASLRERLAFEMLLVELSSRFSRLTEEDVDGEIETWLRRLVQMLDVDRGCFAEVTPAGLDISHSYAAAGVEAYPHGVADGALPWLVSEFRAGRTVMLSRIPDDLPAHAAEERRYMTETGMKAGIGIPIFIGDALVCVLSFVAFRQTRTWSNEVISRLHLAGDVFANAIARRQSKQRLDQKQLELAHLARVAAMGELASVIAHELDQPLTAVVTTADALRNMLRAEEPDLLEADEALTEVINSAMRVSEIVQRERRLLRKSGDRREPVDINEAVREVELFIRAEARQYGARVGLELLPGLPPVPADRVQLQQVVLNLARNGLQAMRAQPAPGRALTIRTAWTTGEVTLSVTDAGGPVEESLVERMFEPFYTTKAEGLGMGLSISKSIVESLRGRIWPTRNPGGGLTMHVSVPRK
jgi:PAS domain S-box-containing protein